ncbi:MAG: wax ester/triacylglycerol synthase domain-containing protein, partial [Nocardioidaceae bacterium]
TNAGGATALEALASGTALVTACPIAAHGDANAALMTVAGLTEICSSESRLEEFIRATADRADSLRPLESRIRERVAGHDLDGGLRRLAAASGPQGRPWPMRPADAFFCHVESPQARQELGVVLELEPESSGTAVGLEQVRRSIQDRTPGLNSTRRVLVRRRRPGWFLRGSVDASRHVDERRLPAESTDAQMWEAVGDFWSAPLPEDEPAWRMQLIHGQGGGRSLFAIKMHHSQGDGISALGLLDRLLDHADDDPVLERRPSGAPGAQTRPQASVLARGLWHLATRGRVTRQPLNARPLSPDRSFVAVPLPWPEVRRLAERYDVRPHELVLALVADGLDRALRPAGLTTGHEPLRAMVPVAMRAPRLDRVFGNWTGSLALDLPMGEMPLYVRAARVRAEARRRAEHGEPQAAGAVVRLAGMLPSAVHRRFTRVVYNRRFFSTIVTYMPGVRRPRWCAGAHVRAMYPVLPLAPGVPLTVGVLVSDGVAGIGVLLDRGLGLGRDAVESAVRDAFTDGGGHFVTQAVDSPAVDSPAVDSPAVDSPAADSPAAGAGQSG